MRLAVLADVHGNLPALEAALADLAKHDVEGIIVAGDHLTGGPYPMEAMRLLRSLDGWMIRGNTGNYLLAYDAGYAPNAWQGSSQWATMRWSYRQVDRETLDFLAALPEQTVIDLHGTAPIRVVHGSPRDPSEPLFPDRDPITMGTFRRAGLLSSGRDPVELGEVLVQVNERVLVCGHTHIPWTQEQGGQLAFNPGSVGSPINGDVRAQYALLAWRDDRWQVEHRAVSYDLDRTRAAFSQNGLLAEGGGFAQACLLSLETGQNVAGYLVSHAYTLAAEAGFEDSDVVPDDIWARAVATFNWDTIPLD